MSLRPAFNKTKKFNEINFLCVPLQLGEPLAVMTILVRHGHNSEEGWPLERRTSESVAMETYRQLSQVPGRCAPHILGDQTQELRGTQIGRASCRERV